MALRNVLKGNLAITRTGSSDLCSLQISDQISGLAFLTVSVKLEDLAKALLGSGIAVNSDLVLRDIEHVGKTREVKRVTLRVSKLRLKKLKIPGYDRGRLENFLVEHKQVSGWSLNPYLGSKDSIEGNTQTGDVLLRFSYTRYV